MPEAILKFKLPDEQSEFDDARQGQAWRAFVEDLSNEFRRCDKYGSEEWAATAREVFYRLLGETSLSLDE